MLQKKYLEKMELDLKIEAYRIKGFWYHDKEGRLHTYYVYPNSHQVFEEWDCTPTADEGCREIKPDLDGWYPITLEDVENDYGRASKTFWICFSQLLKYSNFEEATAPIVDDEQYLDNMKIENGEC